MFELKDPCLVVALLLGILAPGVGATTVPGATPSRLTVSADGAAVLQVPIEVPPGILGFEPSLRLVYQSQRAEGRLGVGWSLAGLPTITRVPQTLAVDGRSGGIRYDSHDRFALSGNRLINVSGVYGGDGSRYRTERETWQRVTSLGICGRGPCEFRVETKDGRILELGGGTGRIRALGQEDVRVWAVSRIVDRNGNSMTLDYTQDPLGAGEDSGQFYPSEIAYGSNESAGVDEPNRFVRFEYEPRSDIRRRFFGGFPVTTAARLARIEISLGDRVIKDYRLNYGEASPATGRSLLRELVECDSEARDASCLHATTFEWQEQGRRFEAPVAALQDSFTAYSGWNGSLRTVADVDGDGLTDVLGIRPSRDRVMVALSRRASPQNPCASGTAYCFQTPVGWLDFRWNRDEPLYFADVDSDGRADLVSFGDEGVTVALSTGDRFGEPKTFPFFGTRHGWRGLPRQTADVNADHLQDLVGFGHDGVYVALARGGGDFGHPERWTRDFSDLAGYVGQIRVLADVDGDQRADVVAFDDPGGYVAVGLSTRADPGRVPGCDSEQGCFDSNPELWPRLAEFTSQQGWNLGNSVRTFADVNGDGHLDLVGFKGDTRVALGTGRSFEAQETAWSRAFGSDTGWGAETPRTLADVNADGLADVVGFGRDGVVVGISTGLRFEVGRWAELDAFGQRTGIGWKQGINPRLPTDVDGDALVDLVGFGNEDVRVAFSAPAYPDLLVEVIDGLGTRRRLGYRPLSDPEVYGESSPAALAHFQSNAPVVLGAAVPTHPVRRLLGGHLYVVADDTESYEPGGESTGYAYSNSYGYSEGEVSLDGRGWLGFASRTRHDAQTGAATTRRYRQAFPWTGRLDEVLYRCGHGASYDPRCGEPEGLLHRLELEYEKVVTAEGASDPQQKVYDVRLRAHRDHHYEYGAYRYTLDEAYRYDDYGNRTLRAYTGYGDALVEDRDPRDDNVYTLGKYHNDPEAWILGRLVVEKVSRVEAPEQIEVFDGATDFSLRKIDYDGDTGNVTSRGTWDDGHDRFLTYRYVYDGFGNRTEVEDPAGNTTTTRFETVYNTYPEVRTSPPNEWGHRLQTRASYDPRFGKQTAWVDANGWPKIHCYDGLGRLAVVQGPVPTTPQGVRSDPSCLSTWATGTGGLTDTEVVTLSTHVWGLDGARMFEEARVLQNWPLTSTRPTRWHRQFLDGRGRVDQEVSQGGPDICDGEIVVDTVYDSDDRSIRVSVPYYRGDTPVFGTSSYDLYGRPLRVERPAGPQGDERSVTTYEYSSDSTLDHVRTVHAAGTEIVYRQELSYRYFEGRQRVHRMVVPEDGSTTDYGYDPLGRGVRVLAPGGDGQPTLESTVSFDSLGRHRALYHPTSGEVSFVYDDEGRLVEKIDVNGTTRFTHDALGRQQTKTRPDGSIVRWRYDETTVANGLGERTRATVGSAEGLVESELVYGYDRYGRTRDRTLSLSQSSLGQSSLSQSLLGRSSSEPDVFVTRRVYDPLGRLSEAIDPTGSTLRHDYGVCHLERVVFDGTPFATFGAYSAAGQPREMHYTESGTTTDRSFFPTGELRRHRVRDPAGKVLLDEVLHWDLLGQLRSIEDLAPDGLGDSQTFDYQTLRLTAASAGSLYEPQNYAYQPNGNLLRKNGVTFDYQGYQVVRGWRDGEQVFSADYDPAGNMIRKTWSAPARGSNRPDGAGGTADGIEEPPSSDWSYVYDSENRLIEARRAGREGADRFLYDFRGRRLRKDGADGSLAVYVDPFFEWRRGAEGEVETRHHVLAPGLAPGQAPGARIARVRREATSGDDEVLYIHQNHLGSVVMTTGVEGGVEGRVGYLPDGRIARREGALEDHHRFTGKELDDATDLYYYGARYYDPLLGRFLTADTGLGGEKTRQDVFNRYEYALASPTVYVDPSGNFPCSTGTQRLASGAASLFAVGSTVATDADVGDKVGGKVAVTLMSLGTVGTAVACAADIYKQRPTTVRPVVRQAGPAARGARQELELVTRRLDPVDRQGARRLSQAERNWVRREYYRLRRQRLARQQLARQHEIGERNGCECFPAGTRIDTESGPRDIVDLRPGDRVWAFDESTGDTVLRRVVRLIRNPGTSDRLVRITLGGEVIEATPEHPFWLADAKRWAAAETLTPGTRLWSRAGDSVEVLAVETKEGASEVYNFEVEEHHNYFVSGRQILVHNASCLGEESPVENAPTELGAGETAATEATEGALVVEGAAAEAGAETAAATSVAETAATEAAAETADALLTLLLALAL